MAAPGELNDLSFDPAPFPHGPGQVLVNDTSAPLSATESSGCVPAEGAFVCPSAPVSVELGDLDDTFTTTLAAPVSVSGGEGDDLLVGGDGDDVLDGAAGVDSADGGPGDDVLSSQDGFSDGALCGPGRDQASAEIVDALEFDCEAVDYYGAPGRVGRLRAVTGAGRFVPIPGQPGEYIDRRLVPSVVHLVRRYRVRITDGFALMGHLHFGEHPLGLAVDIVPGPGGSWEDVGRLARWAEPRQGRPRKPFRWVGYNGDYFHGDPEHCNPRRGCPPHLHLSWAHSPGSPGRPVTKVRLFDVTAAGPFLVPPPT